MAVPWLLAPIDFAAWPLVCIVCKSITSPCPAPSALVLLVSPSQRQSTELFRTLMTYLRRLDGAPRITAESVLQLRTRNGSAGSLRCNTVRGFPGASLIVIDEAARCPDELLVAVRPILATKPDSRLIMLSTRQVAV